MKYELAILFDKQDLSLINQAQEKVVLVQKISGSNYPVIWVAFTPFERNFVTWQDEYFLYASTTLPTPEQQISIVSKQKVQSQNIYTFNQDRTFSEPEFERSLNRDQYRVVNNLSSQQISFLTFGLAQSCIVNSQEIKCLPINAVVVPSKHLATFTPPKSICIFLASNIMTSMIYKKEEMPDNEANYVTTERVESLKTQLDFSNQHQIAVKYNASQGSFTNQTLDF